MILKFGYIMENGRFIIDQKCSDKLVQMVQDYCGGKSLKTIAAELTEAGTEYAPGKCVWNKNRVQRVLTDKAYLGTEY